MKKFYINILDTQYLIKLSIRTLMTYEELSEKNYTDIASMRDMLVYMFSALYASNNDFPYDFDSFIDVIDEQPDIFEQFLSNLMSVNTLTDSDVKKK